MTHPSTPQAKTTVLGLLGGIAAGKSRVARVLAGPVGRVLDADAIAHEVLGRPEIVRHVVATFGPEVLDREGRPDRKALAARIFGDAAARAQLEGWIHPAVRATIRTGVEEARDLGVECVVLDVPLLLENNDEHGLANACDLLVFVDSSAEDRERRAAATRNWQPGEVERREAVQMPLAEKRARADHVIENRGTIAELDAAARDLSTEIFGPERN